MHFNNIVIDDSIEKQILLCKEILQNRVSEIQILKWLNNFEINDWGKALNILSNVKLYSIDNIITELNSHLENIIKTYPNGTIYLHGLGEIGKSGDTMLYFLTHTHVFKTNNSRFKLLTHLDKLKSQGLGENSNLIFVDDLLGTGESALSYYSRKIHYQLIKEKIKINFGFLVVAYMSEAKEFILKKIPNAVFYGTQYEKAFLPTGSVFGYRPTMLLHRELSYRHGKGLFILYDNEKKIDFHHALGYNNSQSLIVFDHSTPNNTLPIIWSNKNGWHPIFPRSPFQKIQAFKIFRQEARHWMSIAKKINILPVSFGDSNNLYLSDINFKLLSIIKLKTRRSNDQHIYQLTGMSINEYIDVLNKGINLGLFDYDYHLTEKAKKLHREIRKKISLSKTLPQQNLSNNLYVPKIFLGKT